MDKMFRSFFSGDSSKKKNIHTIKWKEICSPFEVGGLGIRDSKDNNLALFAKFRWKCLTNEGSLGSKILKAKYYVNEPL